MNVNCGSYKGQVRKFREFAILKFGSEKVASMSDEDLCELFENEGYRTYQISTGEYDDCEVIIIVKQDDIAKLVAEGKAYWLTR